MARVELADLPAILEVSARHLTELARRAPDLYERRTYLDGDEPRELTVPDDALKDLQTRIHERLLRALPARDCVHSARGRSILSNAEQHVKHPHLSVFDIRHCFPSVGPRRVRAALERAGFAPGVAARIARLTTVEHQLPQGAPTSPALLNAVLVDFDGKLDSMARGAGLTYTRYVDDLFLSGGARTERLAKVVEKVVRRHQLQLHPKKRFDCGPGERHTVTNIIINTTPSALPEYVESIEALIAKHLAGTMVLLAAQLETIRGKIGFVTWVNAEQGARLERLLAGDDAAMGRMDLVSLT